MKKTSQKPIHGILFIIGTVTLLLLSNGIASYAQTNSTNMTGSSIVSNDTMNNSSNPNTQPATTAASSSDNPIVTNIDAAISAIKSGDSDGGKKHLYQAESSLEGNSNSAGAEKHIEASLQALKDGDTKGSIMHAEQAKKSLS